MRFERVGRWVAETRLGRTAFRLGAVAVVALAVYLAIFEEVGRQTRAINKRVEVIERVQPINVLEECLRMAPCRRLLLNPAAFISAAAGGDAPQPASAGQPPAPATAGGTGPKSPSDDAGTKPSPSAPAGEPAPQHSAPPCRRGSDEAAGHTCGSDGSAGSSAPSPLDPMRGRGSHRPHLLLAS